MYFAKVKRQDFSHKIKEKYCRIKRRFLAILKLRIKFNI